jgi:hypothetical protein
MQGRLIMRAQAVQSAILSPYVHRHRQSLLQLASRDVEDEAVAKESAKTQLQSDRQEYGSVVEKIRAQPFVAPEKSLYEHIPQIDKFDKNPFYRGSVKNSLRDTNRNTHEWIPCQLMGDCLTRDTLIGATPGLWLQLQKTLRTATSGLIFDPSIVGVLMEAQDRTVSGHNLRQATDFGLSRLYKDQHGHWQTADLQPGDRCLVLQGHEGAMKAGTEMVDYKPDELDTKGWLSFGSTEFHSQLLYCFDRYDLTTMPGDIGQRKAWLRVTLQNFLKDLKAIADRWMWDPANVPPASAALALPFRGYYGEDGGRTGTTVEPGNYTTWLTYITEVKQATLQMIDINSLGLDHILA